MRLARFYTTRQNLRVGSSVKLEDSDITHIKKVLRLEKNDPIILFNGQKEFDAVLSLVGNKVVMAKITEIRKSGQNLEERVQFSIFQGLLRAGKFDFIIEKLTELGINRIVPLETEFSQSKLEVVAHKLSRWEKVAVAAAKQSERIDIPEISEGLTFKSLKQEDLASYDLVIFLTIPRDKIAESKDAESIKVLEGLDKTTIKNVAFFIGAEGGFSPTEHKKAKELGFKFLKLGDNILRSETAGIVALSILQYIFNF